MLIITQAVQQIEDKIQQEMLTYVGKNEDESKTEDFPRGSKIDMGKSVSASGLESAICPVK